MFEKKKLLEVALTNATKIEILEYILQTLEKTPEKYYIVTPNPEILVYAGKHPHFKEVLNNANLALIDGVGLLWAGRILGKGLKGRVTGVDLMDDLCREVSKRPITVGFLGAGGNVAERTAECLRLKYPGLQVVYIGREWGNEGFICDANSKFKIQNSKLQIKSQKPEKANDQRPTTIDLLFVAFGFPKQEEWISRNLPNLPVRIAMGVGGSFDYISGNVPRAPVWIQNLGFEWLYRLIRQPWRLKRQLALVEFIYLIVKERFIKS